MRKYCHLLLEFVCQFYADKQSIDLNKLFLDSLLYFLYISIDCILTLSHLKIHHPNPIKALISLET